MTSAASKFSLAGYTPVGNFYAPDISARHTLGDTITVVDPYFGRQELIYCSFPVSTALSVGNVVVWNSAFSATTVPNTANLGQCVGLVLNAVPSDAANVQYGWVLIAGKFVALSGASVAANAAIGITAAGKLGANSAGKQILNAKVQVAATNTVAKTNVTTQSGSKVFKVSDSDGWFVGLPLSGTGVAASTTITAISTDGMTVTVNNNATASGSVTVTGTYNDGSSNYWNTLDLDRAFAQGAIT